MIAIQGTEIPDDCTEVIMEHQENISDQKNSTKHGSVGKDPNFEPTENNGKKASSDQGDGIASVSGMNEKVGGNQHSVQQEEQQAGTENVGEGGQQGYGNASSDDDSEVNFDAEESSLIDDEDLELGSDDTAVTDEDYGIDTRRSGGQDDASGPRITHG
jgi:hypothetical protein